MASWRQCFSFRATSYVQSHHGNFMKRANDIIIKYIMKDNKVCPVLRWNSPKELENIFDLQCKTSHPRFLNQMFGGFDTYGHVGQWTTDALNTSNYTYEMASLFVLMEEKVMKKLSKMIGWNYGEGDGIMSAGGSMANFYGVQCARQHLFPDVKEEGMYGTKPMAIFTSEDSHYSFMKAANLMGFGTNSVFKVKVNDIGQMDVGNLRKNVVTALDKGFQPLIVVSTAGTTVLGAFDDIEQISDIANEFGMWHHVDAAWGGSVLFTETHKRLLQGIDRVDSVTLDIHKMLGAPLQCSWFLTRKKDILTQCNSMRASYLFQPDKCYDTSLDTGDKSLQCSRKVDIFKFWLSWRAKGSSGVEKHVNTLFEKTNYFVNKIKSRPQEFELILENPQLTNVCFYFIPPSLRKADKNSQNYKHSLSKVAPKIKERMLKQGTMMIGYQSIRGLPNFFRLVLSNSGTSEEDLDFFLDEISRLGKDL
ncbi:Cysteine sulfinic acid decarboxylase [Nymphon striatum]|nr:Cysteine sulfinic acid decarboxylase [Nymphon striatum]